MLNPGWEFECIAPFQVEPVASDRDKIIGCQAAFSPLGYRIEFLLQTRDKVVGLLRKSKFGIGQVALLCPACGVVDKVRKGHMAAALWEIDVAGSETITDGHGQPEFPGATIERGVSLVQR